MKRTIILSKESRKGSIPYSSQLKRILFTVVLITGFQIPFQAQAQDSYSAPSWWIGVAAGANFDFYDGSTQKLNASFKPPVAFHDGFGVGLFLAPTIEYYRPNSKWGMLFQFGYDNRNGKFKEVLSPCNCPADLSTKLSYLTIEPSVRFTPFSRSSLFLYAGPRLAFNINKSYVYQLRANPAFSDQEDGTEIKGEFSDIRETILSAQIGVGYDIPLSSPYQETQFVLSPFISFQPYFGQSPRSIETWNITNIRIGATLKLGKGKKASAQEEKIVSSEKEKDIPNFDFKVTAPKNIPEKRTVKESFPLLNNVFFDLGSTEIPERYVSLNRSQVANFKEEKLELSPPKDNSGRSERQMIVYYNVLNILGIRMLKNPNTKVSLVGSSEKGPTEARAMAESVKSYLVLTFEIDPLRITTDGLTKPKVPSEKPGSTNNLVLLREEDRRVSIESSSTELLMEFQSGPDAPLKPVEIVGVQEAPVESYVRFENKGAKGAFSSWTLQIKEDNGKTKTFGPFVEDKVVIPGKDIMGTKPKGNYQVKMIGITRENRIIERESNVDMVLWTPPETDIAIRFSVPYAFDASKSIAMYEKYLAEVVVPKIPQNGRVIIHGYTDIIGDAAHNKVLSEARANDVKKILESALSKSGRADVEFQVYGFGKDAKLAQFENKYPEERFYNRTVIIDLIP